MNKYFIALIFLPIALFAFNAPEYTNNEFIVDEKSVSFDEEIIYNFFSYNNYAMISGGCYNVEWLSMSDLIRLHIPIGKSVYFDYLNMSIGRIEGSYKLYGFGLSWHINRWFNVGFIANPLFEKRESDFALSLGFEGYNTKNMLLVSMVNFDNNYAHKNDNDRYPYPRIYTSPYIPFNSTSYFPIDLYFISTGYIKSIDFYFMLKTGTGFSADYYVYADTLGDIYSHSADSSAVYMRTGMMNEGKWNGYEIINSIFLSSMVMDNGYGNSLYYSQEHDSRFTAGYSGQWRRGIWSIPLTLEYTQRTVSSGDINQYSLGSFTGGLGLGISPGSWEIELLQIINAYESKKTDDSLDMTQSRLQLSVKYHFSDYAYFMARKGLETDPRDLANGGRFFFYDKMYVQFACNIDRLFKEYLWTDL